jgi:hypothetical protein
MKPKPTREMENRRILSGPTGSDESYGNNGQFCLVTKNGIRLLVQISDGMGWEHASVSLIKYKELKRCPTWEEMCFVKDAFWEDEECVIQYHPPKSQYINCHLYVLHLWKPIFEGVIPTPPSILVGPKKEK